MNLHFLHRLKFYFKILLLLIFFLGLGYLEIGYFFKKTREKKEELKELKKELNSVIQEEELLVHLKKGDPEIEKALLNLQQYLPQTNQTNSLIISLKTIAQTNGLSINRFRIDSPQPTKQTIKNQNELLGNKRLYEIPINIEATGNFPQILGFLNSLNQFSPLLKIKNPSLKFLNQNSLEIKLQLVSYFKN